MSNLFINSKTIGDLHEVFTNNPEISFETATDAELERLADVFNANVAQVDMPDVPLDENGFNYIKSFVADKVNDVIENIENTNPQEIKEENKMGTVKENLNLAIDEMFGKFEQAKQNIKGKAGQTAEEYVQATDDSLNIMKGALGTVLEFVDKQLGFSMLKHNVLAILEAGSNGQTKGDLFAMSKECRVQIDDFIDTVENFGDPDKAEKLKELFGLMKEEDLFTKFFSTLTWISRKVTRKLKKLGQVDEEKSVIGAICRSLAGFAGVIKAGIQIAWNATKFAVSFIAAGLIKFGAWIVNTIRTLVEKSKDWLNKKNQVIEVEDDDFDESLDEDFE